MSKASAITLAYNEARAVVGLPETERETKLFTALQNALQELHGEDLHKGCVEELQDVQDELDKADRGWLSGSPDPDVNLVEAKRIIERRRLNEPIGTIPDKSYTAVRLSREATDMLEELLGEVEAWRKLRTL